MMSHLLALYPAQCFGALALVFLTILVMDAYSDLRGRAIDRYFGVREGDCSPWVSYPKPDFALGAAGAVVAMQEANNKHYVEVMVQRERRVDIQDGFPPNHHGDMLRKGIV